MLINKFRCGMVFLSGFLVSRIHKFLSFSLFWRISMQTHSNQKPNRLYLSIQYPHHRWGFCL